VAILLKPPVDVRSTSELVFNSPVLVVGVRAEHNPEDDDADYDCE